MNGERNRLGLKKSLLGILYIANKAFNQQKELVNINWNLHLLLNTNMKIDYNKFKNDPVLYVLFLPLLAMVALFFMLKEATGEQINDKNIQIEKAERRIEKVDSINHALYETLGAKKIVDSINNK